MSQMLDRIASGRTDLVIDYLALGNAATSADKDGTSLSQHCVYYGDVSALRYLLERGETLSSLGDNFGLDGAAFHGHWRLCEFLIESGADPKRAQADTGETPLHAALCTSNRVRHDLVVRVLLDRGASPNAVTTPGVETGAFMRDCRTKGETPLHRAAAFGGEETIDMLLAADGESPLSWGSWYGRPDAILQKLCYGRFRIRSGRKSMEAYVTGEPVSK
jgi:palmitoyltransferase